MSHDAQQQINAFNRLQPLRYPIVRNFQITREDGEGYSLRMATISHIEKGQLLMAFYGIRDVAIDWPQWDEIRLDVVEITDITDRGLEGLTYRVHEGAGFFAFSCRDFTAEVE